MPRHNKGKATITRTKTAGGISRRAMAIGLAAVAGAGTLGWMQFGSSKPADARTLTVWKSSTCGCCGEWASYMRSRGYRVTIKNVNDPDSIKRSFGIPGAMYSCHTAKIGNYLVEGHVPAVAVAKLLEEQPDLKGIALPGMPQGSPGMDGVPGVYRVMGFTADGATSPFMDARG